MAEHDNQAGSVLLAFVLGAAAGAAIALLLAPATGEETRKKLADKAREGKEKLETLAREGREAFDQARKEFV